MNSFLSKWNAPLRNAHEALSITVRNNWIYFGLEFTKNVYIHVYQSFTTYVSCRPYWQSVGVSKLVQTEGKGGIWDTHRNITMAHTFGILRTKRCQYSLARKCVCCVRINKKLGPCTIKVSLLLRFFTLILKELFYSMFAQNLFINSNINNQG